MFGMNDLSPCLILKVSNVLFCLAILKVGIDSTITDGLPRLSHIGDEGVVCESPIVGMTVKNLDSWGYCVGFECLLGSECLLGGEMFHEADAE